MRTRYATLLLATLLLAGCGGSGTDPSGRLLAMAGEEAAGISNTLDRFTRQLNIANTQLATGRKPDAARTLALARETLRSASPGDFDDFHRIAGWTAISQLARQADASELARESSDAALAALNDVQPTAERPQYVLSLATELKVLRGRDSAVELLGSGGAWAADIRDAPTRRTALVTFADALVTEQAFENARQVLRHDPDVAWRTDTLLAMANRREAKQAGSAMASARTVDQPPQTAPAAEFNKDVRFENVYRR